MNALRTFARAVRGPGPRWANRPESRPINTGEGRSVWLWAALCFLVRPLAGHGATVSYQITKSTTAPMHWHVVINDTSQGPPAGSIVNAPNYGSTVNTGVIGYGNFTSNQAGSATVWAYNGAMPNFGTATHAQMVAAGAYAVGTFSWSAGQTGALSPVNLTGSAPPTYPKHVWNQNVCNRSGFVQRYRFGIDYASGTDYTETFTLQPGQCRDLSVENTVAFTPSLEVENVLSDGQGTVWVPTELDDVTSTTQSSQPPPVNTGTTSNGNIWTDTDAPTRLGTQPPITANTETRSDTTASTGDTLNRQREANDEKRHAELKSLLVAADSAEAKRDTVQLDAFNQGMARLQAQTAASGAAVAAAINGLKGSLEAGQSGTQPTFNGTGAATDLQGRTTGAGGALEDLLPEVTIPAAEAPKLILPFSLLHEDLEDVEWDFGSDELAPVVEKVRAVELVGLTCFFFLAALRLIGGK